jgi:LemA protein
MKKKSGFLALVAVLILIIGFFFYGVSCYNGFVTMQEEVRTGWSQVENQYQRRADLIPNLVNTVKGYAKHEKETLESVIQARSQATAVKVDPANMTEEQLANFHNSQNGLSQALGRLMVVVEKYPELKADANFRDLQSQLEGTENRITVARRDFNEVAKKYNTDIRRFPATIVASITGFKPFPYFKSNEGAEKAPEVQF